MKIFQLEKLNGSIRSFRSELLGQSYTSRAGAAADDGPFVVYHDIVCARDRSRNDLVDFIATPNKFVEYIVELSVKLWYNSIIWNRKHIVLDDRNT